MICARSAFGPIDRDAAQRARVEREDAFVAQQDHGGGGRLARERAVLGPVDRALGCVGLVVERADAVERAQQPHRLSVDELPRRPARRARRRRAPGRAPGGPGHLEVEARGRRALGRREREPVGHDEALEAPLAAQDPAEQLRVLRAVAAVQAVVSRHDAERAALADGELEGHEVKLVQRPLVDDGVDRVALELRLVAREVLDRRDDALRLQAAHVAGRGTARQQRVLREALEVAARERRAVEVERRGEQDAAALRARLLAQEHADALDERRVPRRPEGRAAGDADGGRLAGAEHGRPARAAGAVGHAHGRHAGRRGRRPHVAARGQARLLVEGEPGDEGVDVAHG